MKYFLQSFTLTRAGTHAVTCALTLSLLSASLSAKLQATPIGSNLVSINYTPPPPPDRGAPGNRGEGASRGCTSSAGHPLMALVPEQTLNAAPGAASITQVWGLTSTSHPRFWFSVPYDPANVSAIEFVLQNDQEQTIYRTPIPVPPTPGILAVQLPSTVSGLEINKQYHWFFKVRVVCESNQTAMLEYVEGWVQRTQLDQGLSDRLTHATLQQRTALYAANGIWYDALTTLAELKLAQPEDRAIAQDWADLLKSVGLGNLATQPLIH